MPTHGSIVSETLRRLSPELTIVVPMYGVEKYIGRCLDSIFANPHARTKSEVLLIDDGSPDNSSQVAMDWIKLHHVTNVSIISQENKGLGGARNTGLRLASGKWIWFVDADDEIMPDAIENITCRLNPSLDFITFEFFFLPQNTLGYGYAHAHDCISPEVLASRITLNSPCFNIFRVNFLRDNDLWFKEKFLHEDNEFAIRVNFRAKQVAFYPIVIYKYYTANGGSITNTTVSPKKIDDLLAHFKTYKSLLKERPSRLQHRAMQQVNVVPTIWLLKYLKCGTLENRVYARRQIIKHRFTIRRSASLMPLRYQLSIWMHTSPLFYALKV